MTKQEFIICCSLFEKYFKGKSLKEILNDNRLIPDKLIEPVFKNVYIGTFSYGNINKNNIFDCLIFFRRGLLFLNGFNVGNEFQFGTVKDFLNRFNISLEDDV